MAIPSRRTASPYGTCSPQAPRRRPVRPAPHRERRPRLHLLRRLPEGVPRGLHRRAPGPLALARQGQGAPLRRHDHPRRAPLHDLQPLHGGLQVRRARAHGALPRAPPPRAGAGARDAAALQRPRPLQRLRRLHRRQPGAEPGRRATTSSPAPPAASRSRPRATRTPPGRAATSTPTSRTPRPRSPASRPPSAPSTSAASSRSGSSSSPSAATAAPTTSACRRSPAPWSAATTCSTCATTTAAT